MGATLIYFCISLKLGNINLTGSGGAGLTLYASLSPDHYHHQLVIIQSNLECMIFFIIIKLFDSSWLQGKGWWILLLFINYPFLVFAAGLIMIMMKMAMVTMMMTMMIMMTWWSWWPWWLWWPRWAWWLRWPWWAWWPPWIVLLFINYLLLVFATS